MLAVSVAQTTISRTCRARFPADAGSLDAAAESRQLSRILALLGGPREARGRLTAPGALRRRPRFARRGALRAPRLRALTALRAVPGLGGLFGFAVVSSLLIWKHP